MGVSHLTRISATSPIGFEDAVKRGLDRASSTVRGITGLKVLSQEATVKNGIAIDEYKVELEIAFTLEAPGRR